MGYTPGQDAGDSTGDNLGESCSELRKQLERGATADCRVRHLGWNFAMTEFGLRAELSVRRHRHRARLVPPPRANNAPDAPIIIGKPRAGEKKSVLF